jgi:hypothetical protein
MAELCLPDSRSAGWFTPLSKGADATQSRGGIFTAALDLRLNGLPAGNNKGQGSRQRRKKALKAAWLGKIPPLACGQSAPFDKGVRHRSPASMNAANNKGQGSRQRRKKALRAAWLGKIYPLACGQSAPFDKGVNLRPSGLVCASAPLAR